MDLRVAPRREGRLVAVALCACLCLVAAQARADTANVGVFKSSWVRSALPGSSVTFSVDVSNYGPDAVTGAWVDDPLPAGLRDASWTCTVRGAGTCPASGTADLHVLVNLPANTGLAFKITATLEEWAVGVITNTASVVLPAGVSDPFPDDNTATATLLPIPIAQSLEPEPSLTQSVGSAKRVVVSGDGRNVYASGWPGTTVFSRDANTGALGSVGSAAGEIFAVSPDGVFAYGWDGWGLGIYARDQGSGALVAVDSKPITWVNGAAVSPDGRYVYVASEYGDKLHVYLRDTSGQHTSIQTLTNGQGGVRLMARPRGVAVSPDGNDVYVASQNDSAVAVFHRTVDGSLAFAHSARAGSYLAAADSCTLSPDGRFVYVGAWGYGSISVFARDPGTGALSLADVERDGLNGVDGLNGGGNIALSPDGTRLYASGYFDNALAVFAADAASGVPRFEGIVKDGMAGVSGLQGPLGLSMSPDGRHLYVASQNSSTVTVFTAGRAQVVRPVPGSALASETVGFHWSAGFEASPYRITAGSMPGANGYFDSGPLVTTSATVTGLPNDGSAVFVRLWSSAGAGDRYIDYAYTAFASAYRESSLWIVKSADMAAVPSGDPVRFTIVVGNRGPAAVAGAPVTDSLPAGLTNPAWTCVATPGSSCAASGTGGIADTPTVLSAGRLQYTLTAIADASGGGAVYNNASVESAAGLVDRDPSDHYSYTQVAVFASSPSLRFVEAQLGGPDGIPDLEAPRSIAASPDGRSVYAGSSGVSLLKIVGFEREPGSGRLRFADSFAGASRNATMVSADGKSLYGSDWGISLWQRDAAGRLVFDQFYDPYSIDPALSGVSEVALSPDGRSLYAAADNGNGLSVFDRDVASGRLVFRQSFVDGINGVDGLQRARHVLVSKDGRHVYVSGYTDNLIAVFGRDATGLLTFVQAQAFQDLLYPEGLASSPDGAQVYVAGWGYSTIHVLSRDAATGSLSLLEANRNGYDGIQGLNPTAVVVSPDGSRLFANGYFDDAVVAFRRSPDGRLTFDGIQRDGFKGVTGLRQPFALALSPDGNSLYVAANASSALAVFSVTNTWAGDAVVVRPRLSAGAEGPATLTFAHVATDGTTSVVVSDQGPPLPGGFVLGNPPTYVDVETTAVFASPLQVCLSYAGIAYTADAPLALFHYEGGAWTNVTTSVDPVSQVVCGSVDSLSPFAVLQPSNRPPVAKAGDDRTVECSGSAGAVLTLDGSASFDPDGDPLVYSWQGPFGTVGGRTASVTLPLGRHTVTLTVSDGRGGQSSDSVTVTVSDTTPPTISGASTSPASLWPPNGKMVNVTVNYAATDNSGTVTCGLGPVTSNEAITPSDWKVVDTHHVRLAASRTGKGAGRIYTIPINCRDPSGNRVSLAVTVTVPHDQGR